MGGSLTAWQRWRMCDRKKAYETQSKANKAAAKFDGYVYECPVCYCWHTTGKDPEWSKETKWLKLL